MCQSRSDIALQRLSTVTIDARFYDILFFFPRDAS